LIRPFTALSHGALDLECNRSPNRTVGLAPAHVSAFTPSRVTFPAISLPVFAGSTPEANPICADPIDNSRSA